MALRALGHNVEVIAPCDDTPANGVISVGRSHRFRVNGSIAAMAPGPAAARRTRQALRDGDYDVVHLHEPVAASITIPALLVCRQPMVGTFHAAGDRTPYRWAAPALRPLVRRLDVRVAVSAPARDLAREHLGGDYELLFNAIDPSLYGCAHPSSTCAPMILFIGRHEPRKGLDVLLEAFESLPGNVTLWICGNGPRTAALKRRYGDPRVRWLGTVSEEHKLSCLRAASIVCVPARGAESFGIVLLEAIASAVPVVATDLPGHRAVAGEISSVTLVPPGDVAPLRTALRSVLGDQATWHRRAAQEASRVRRFDFHTLARRYDEIYTRLLAS